MAPNQQRQRATGFILFGLFILWGFGWETVGRRLWTAVDGVIVASRDVPSKGAPRYSTEYTVRGADGHEHVFWAGPTDGSLARSMPVGTHIRKLRWHLGYERDGRTEEGGYIFYGLILGIGVSLITWGIRIFRSQRRLPDGQPGHLAGQ